ncbi:hypothetical protein PCE1_004005 [Barthelona sp. PCE]
MTDIKLVHLPFGLANEGEVEVADYCKCFEDSDQFAFHGCRVEKRRTDVPNGHVIGVVEVRGRYMHVDGETTSGAFASTDLDSGFLDGPAELDRNVAAITDVAASVFS